MLEQYGHSIVTEVSAGKDQAFQPRGRLWRWYMKRYSVRYQRLQCAIDESHADIEAFERKGTTEYWLTESRYLTKKAQAALDAGVIDGGWTLLNAASRKLIYGKTGVVRHAILSNITREIADETKFFQK